MYDIHTTENEFRSQVTHWLNSFIELGTAPFEVATSDPSLKSEAGIRFPDIQIWLNRQTQQGFCGWELKTPRTPVDNQDLLENAAQKARVMQVNYFVTWNMKEAVIWRTPEHGAEVAREHRLKTYPAIHQIREPDDLWVESKKVLLKNLAKDILYDLVTLHRQGHLHLIEVDTTFFVHILAEAVKTLAPYVYDALREKTGKNKNFREGLFAWARKQGIKNYGDERFFNSTSRQIVYRTLGKVLFYQTLRRFNSHLPELNLREVNPAQGTAKLKEFFELARDIDYQAVFEEDFTDKVDIPASAIKVLAELIYDLNRFNFSHMPQDVIGQVFERLIPPEERHLLGQYFTPEDLVDIINAFCIRSKNDKILDPTCGTGTFLIRAYRKLKHLGEHNHNNLLSQLWGIDISHFPAELATINLFRQNLSDYRNFPRILSKDIFEVTLGAKYKFPPPRITSDPNFMIDEVLPEFDGVVGNFPYIRQELIEKSAAGYKQKLKNTIEQEWGSDLGQLKLSGQADIYAYLFFHTAHFLKRDGGRIGIVTSNSWLDVAYGCELQRFFLNHFKIVAILESRCEPWFSDPAVNTIVTILERCEDKEKRDEHIVKFVKVKKKLKDIIRYDMNLEAVNRWGLLDRLALGIELAGAKSFKLLGDKQGIKTHEDEDFRIRLIRQGKLLEEAEKAKKTVKWGKYLRAPQVYFEILEKCRDKLVPLKEVAEIRFGIKTGINKFFYLTEDKIKHWGIEEEFLKPVLRSPREFKGILVEKHKLQTIAFICRKNKTELRREHKTGALKYIQWGEKQITDGGAPWPEVPSVQGRSPGWWALPDLEPAQIFWSKAHDIRFIHRYSKIPLFCDCRIYFITSKEINAKVLAVALNSSISAFFMELIGRINLGEGALDVMVEDAQEYMLIPNIFHGDQMQILREFDKLLSRPINPIFEEVKLKDRQRLDRLVLEAMGLDPKQYLLPIYKGLCGLVRERLDLAKMRKKVKVTKIQRDIKKLKEQVIEEILPNGAKRFPEEFLPVSIQKDGSKKISIPQEPLKLGEYFLGEQEVVSGGGFKYQAQSLDEAKFILYAPRPNSFIIEIPTDKIIVQKAVDAYEKYLKKLKDEFFKTFSFRTHDLKQADNFTQQVFEELGLPEV